MPAMRRRPRGSPSICAAEGLWSPTSDPVDMPIGAAGLRYFFDQDRDPSRRLLEELDWFFQGQSQWAPDQASDFTHYTPKPRRGNVELWLPTS